VLAAVKKGSLPRKPEHREALREALDITPDDWAGILAVSGRDHIDLGGSAPTLQQLVLKAILGRGQTEQTFAQESGVPYPTILGVTRKGAIPRTETLVTMAAALSLALADVTAAVERSKAIRREGSPPVPDPATQSLAQMVANTARRNGQSLAAFARVHSLPYLAVMKLVGSGEPPTETDILERFAQALGMDTSEFGSLVDRSRDCPEPASMVNEDGDQVTPLQAALKSVIEQKALTMKAFAELSELSVLTATRLVKHGALPSRTTTHAKLRSLLDLDEQTYGDLVSRSKGAPQTDAIGDEDFQHQETEEIMPDGENGEALARRSLDPELVRLICGLDPRKRDALKVFLKTLA
jgi:predicted transcriptional regulator